MRAFTFFSGSTAPVAATLSSSSFSLFNKIQIFQSIFQRLKVLIQTPLISMSDGCHFSLPFVLLLFCDLLQQLQPVALFPLLRGLISFSSTYTTQSQVGNNTYLDVDTVNKIRFDPTFNVLPIMSPVANMFMFCSLADLLCAGVSACRLQ